MTANSGAQRVHECLAGSLQSAQYPVSHRLRRACQDCLEVNETLQVQCRSGPVCRDADDNAEREDERWRSLVWLRLPRLAWHVGCGDHRAQLGAYRSTIDFSGVVMQLPRWVEEAHVRLWLPIDFGDGARDECVANVSSHDCRVGREIGIVVQPSTCERQMLICYQDNVLHDADTRSRTGMLGTNGIPAA